MIDENRDGMADRRRPKAVCVTLKVAITVYSLLSVKT